MSPAGHAAQAKVHRGLLHQRYEPGEFSGPSAPGLTRTPLAPFPFSKPGTWISNAGSPVEPCCTPCAHLPGLGAEVINRLDGTAVNLPGGEIMPALQSRAIDATEWAGPWNDLAFRFCKITTNYYGPGFLEPTAALELSVNKEAWDGLGPEFQAVVENAATATNVRMLAEFTAANVESQRVLVESMACKYARFHRRCSER